ncbi:MAG TPA: hypothetical protein VGI24_07590 [Solirubrobacteraceae bacterium]
MTGTYALTTEWESTPVSVWCNKGERLPLITVADEGPHWFVLVGTPSEVAQAA